MTATAPRTIDKASLVARLAEGHAAGISVVTPNRRLAQALAAEFERAQAARGLAVWETADILPYTAFVERAYEELASAQDAQELPRRLAPAEEQFLWEEALGRGAGDGALLALPETAALAREAWALAHAWRLWPALERAAARAALGEDARAFLDWAARYRARTERRGLADAARLADLLGARLGGPGVRKPRLLVRHAFEHLTPQQEALFAALAAQGCEIADCAPARRAGRALRLACADAREEYAAAARWARARLEADPRARIGLVVPQLARERDAVRRALRDALAPGGADPRAPRRRAPFNVSLGEPLPARPLAAHALLVLALLGREVEFERASRILRSPFIAGAERERDARARLDAALRRRAEPLVDIERLAALVARPGAPRAPLFAERLAALARFRRERLFGARGPRGWGEAFGEALAVAGFPGERALDSDEYQTLQKWHAVLAEFAALERVAGKLGFAEALARLQRIALGTIFQPETPQVPIQVLGVLEAAGMEFDHLWVSGLSDEAWPEASRANPLVPYELQRAAGVPQASPGAALDFGRRLTEAWLGCAGEVVLSHPLHAEDRALAPSPLIAHLAQGALELPEHAHWRERLRRSRQIERIADARAPAAAPGAAPGGAALVRDQAACPFRALAVHRLGAGPLEAPHAGLDALERGTLVHRVLAAAWRELKDKTALDALPEAALDRLLGRAADEALAWQRRDRPTLLDGRFAQVERARLVRLARAWLEHERQRGEFRVLATEDKRALTLGPLTLNVRLDRVDETGEGVRIVIDYKTGRASLGAMLGARPDEPQLPLYVVCAEPGAGAAAFAQVRAGAMRFTGLAREEGVLEGAATPAQAEKRGAQPSWEAQVAYWRAELERLARDYAGGRGEVDPKRQLATCRDCAVRPFCRIYERISTAPGAAEI